MICNLCPRKCSADRTKSEGYCRSGKDFRLARAMLHYWEEPCISGKSGSGAVFFSGCNLRCVYCQNYEISHCNKGKDITQEQLVRIFENLVEQGANNINLVNPTHFSPMIAKVLKEWKSPVPIVYNSSGYESVETLKIMEELVDIYLPDFKYIRSAKAKLYSDAPDYPEIAKAALREMKRQVPEYFFDEQGIMQKGVIIRHLILPSNTNPSIELLDYLAENYGDTYLSLMAQYIPCGNLDDFPQLQRSVTKREYNKVVDHAIDLGFEKLFVQDLSSASEDYIPSFNFQGID